MPNGKELAQLRRRIRESARQFRAEDDNSSSLFHPKKGFVHAYDIKQVEEALDAYEEALGSQLGEVPVVLEPKEYLRHEAELFSKLHASSNIRAFARDVLEFLENGGKGPPKPAPVLELVRRDSEEGSENHPED